MGYLEKIKYIDKLINIDSIQTVLAFNETLRCDKNA